MALSNTTVRAVYNGNGSTTTFAIPFPIIETASTEVQVWLRDESALPVTDTLQTITTDYTLTGAGPDNVEMNVAPTANQKLLIRRILPLTQNVEYTGTNAFPADSHELALDRIVAQVQQVNERIDRCPTVLPSSPLTLPLSLPEPEADKFISWNSSGTALENKASTSSTGGGTIINSGGSSTDNAVPKWVGTAGDDIQNTGVIIDDSNNVSGIGNLSISGNLSLSGGNALITGALSATGYTKNIVAKTASYTATVTDDVILCSGGTITITLPSASGIAGKIYTIKKTDTSGSNLVTIDGDAAETIDGDATYVLDQQNQFVTIISNGTNWNIIEESFRLKWQRKVLSADVTSTTADVTDLKFSNLVTGKTYRLTTQAAFTVQGSTHSGTLQALNNSSVIMSLRMGAPTYTGVGPIGFVGGSTIFTAAASTVVFSYTDTGGSADLLGDGSLGETFSMIELIQNPYNTSEY